MGRDGHGAPAPVRGTLLTRQRGLLPIQMRPAAAKVKPATGLIPHDAAVQTAPGSTARLIIQEFVASFGV